MAASTTGMVEDGVIEMGGSDLGRANSSLTMPAD